MEKSMNKTNDTSKFDHAKLEDHRLLADSELELVSGGAEAKADPVVSAVMRAAVYILTGR